MARDIVRDLTGRTFDRLEVLRYLGKSKWLCRCRCGTEKSVRADHLVQERIRSCGCLAIEMIGDLNRKYEPGTRDAPEYATWSNIKSRCNNEGESEAFAKYGAKGIRVCDGWTASYESFLEDMGRRPSSTHSIDRIDFKSGYDCGHCDDCVRRGVIPNCRWADKTTQAQNRSVTLWYTYRGETRCLREWARILGANEGTLRSRLLNLGWSVERAFGSVGPSNRRMFDVDGEQVHLSELARRIGVKPSIFHGRLKRGMTVEEAMAVVTKKPAKV